MTSNSYTGTGVALITPFSNGTIDFNSLARIIDHVISGGADYVVSLGTTGETPTLSSAEKQEVLTFTVNKVDGRVPIVAGFGGNNTSALIASVKSFDLNGVSAILSASPSYNKPSQRGIIAHYRALADTAPHPVILYNVPGRTCSNITAETTLELATHPNIIGIKEASGDIQQATEIIRNAPENFLTISGDDPTALALIGTGGHGVISVIANALPRDFSTMIRHAINGDVKSAQLLNNRLFPIHHWLYVEGNPVGIKEACSYLDLCKPEVRLPLVQMTDANKMLLHRSMKNAGY